MSKVSMRGGFSDRNAIKPENRLIQLKDFDERTRIQLNNMICKFYRNVYDNNLYYAREELQEFFRFVLGTVYSKPLDVKKEYKDEPILNEIKNTILNSDYDDVLTLIEALVRYWDDYLKETRGNLYFSKYEEDYVGPSLFEIVNEYFEREYIGYRFLDDIITAISDPHEVSAVEEALSTEFEPVYDHISKANAFLADRDNPDYENSIKESISAVEAITEIVTGKKGKEANLGSMLKHIEDHGVELHGGLKAAFMNLYGFASDAKGIRHAGYIYGADSTFEEAKYILVTCCAFINYLTALFTK